MLTNLRKSFFEKHRKDLVERILQEKRNKVMMHFQVKAQSGTERHSSAQHGGFQYGGHTQPSFQNGGSNLDKLKDQISKAIDLADTHCMVHHIEEYRQAIECHFTPLEASFIYSLMPRMQSLEAYGKLDGDLGRDVQLNFLDLLLVLAEKRAEEPKDDQVLSFAAHQLQFIKGSQDHERLTKVR